MSRKRSQNWYTSATLVSLTAVFPNTCAQTLSVGTRGCHSGHYEHSCLLGSDVMHSCRSLPTFWRKTGTELSDYWSHIPEDCNQHCTKLSSTCSHQNQL
jgi:hypothetical protein